MSKSIFIVDSDTVIGKTFISERITYVLNKKII